MANTKEQQTLEHILREAFRQKASDVHLKAGIVPVVRIWGRLLPISEKAATLSGYDIDNIAFSIMDEKQKQQFREFKHIDLGYGISGLGRFRINIFRQRGTTRMVIRNIPFDVPKLSELNLPETVFRITEMERGLVLVTGVTGSGKSTTLAAMINEINNSRNKHIVTIEDPIEYLIRDKKCIISQREIGSDAHDFSTALKSALRQDPDIILIGEMRDRETMETALTAAETGHLVLSTLHTADATETIHRILTAFPPHQHAQIRYQLASVLKAVVSQRLAQRKDNQGFVPAVEVLYNNARVAEMISEPGRTSEIQQAIEEGQVSWGMQTFDQSLMQLLDKDLISYEHALELASNKPDFELRYSGVSATDGKKWTANSDSRQRSDQRGWERIKELDIEQDALNASGEDPKIVPRILRSSTK